VRRNLSLKDLGDLLDLPILAILAIPSPRDGILMSPVWHEWTDGGFSVITWAKDIKSRRLSENPACSIVVAEQVRPYRSIELRGIATINQQKDSYEILRRIASRYLGNAKGDTYSKEYENNNVGIELIRIKPGILRTWDFSDDEF